MSNHSTQTEEIWKDVVGYEGYYEVSNLGRVKSVARWIYRRGLSPHWVKERLLETGKTAKHVSLCKQGKIKNRVISILVLEAFVGPRPEGMQCCHFPDRDRSNNRLDNLRWDTPKENYADSIKQGMQRKGNSHGMAILDDRKVRRIRKMHATGCVYKPSIYC